MTTTNFDDWLDDLTDDSTYNIYDLYMSIERVTSIGDFKCSEKNGKYFIQTPLNDSVLMLNGEKAKDAFLKQLDYNYGGDFGWVGGQYEFERSMGKDD
ncbi:MAG: hypothetical protein EAZ08_06985 [Cytophagales bacterium]|nr:MAG: hypothetical protein EAZ08_06985 [Cytophagales bacterium]